MPLRSNPVAQWPESPESGAAVSIVAAYLYEVAPADFRLTTDATIGTHAFNSSGGTLSIVPRSALDGSAYLVAKPDGTFFIMET